jgi:hypothetical protein
MAALLPAADRSFSISETSRSVAGTVRGRLLPDSAARMDFAKAEIPGLVEMTLDDLLETPRGKLQERLETGPVVLIRSQEIDGAGENLPNALARQVMGTVLESIRKGVLRLADAGVSHFVVTADHGHLFSSPRGDDMKIDPPSAGTQADLHRRCWLGRGGSTPDSCVRIAGRDLGYDTDLDLVVPKGAGVFKAGGDLAFHHGGLSLQELVIPVLTFTLQGRRPTKRSGPRELLSLQGVPREITNRIFSLSLVRPQLDLPTVDALRVRVVAFATRDDRMVGQAAFATPGWDADGRVVLLGTEPVAVGVQLDDDDVDELRVRVIDASTERVLTDTSPIPVRLLR